MDNQRLRSISMSGKKGNFQTDGTSEIDKDKINQPPQDRMISSGADSAPLDLIGTKEGGVFQRIDFERALKKASRPKESQPG
jgi:hypothetical protein